jgi:transcriptional regulator with PAS, ATPase and Fis domain
MVTRLLTHSDGEVITGDDVFRAGFRCTTGGALPSLGPGLAHGSPRSRLEDAECRLIEEALGASGGNKANAARSLGIGRMALERRIKRYRL